MLVTCGGSGYIAIDPLVNTYAANDPAIEYSDCVMPTLVNGFQRFQRPIADTGSDYQYCMPGARQRFTSSSPIINAKVRFNGLVTRADSRNFVGAVYCDGVFLQTWQTPFAVNVVGVLDIVINSPSAGSHLYEIILPYADGVEFGPLAVNKPDTIAAPTTLRNTLPLMVTLGDSITQGFLGTDIRNQWAFRLASAKGWRNINMGYGGRITVAADGIAVAALNPSRIVILLGTNDFLQQIPLATSKAALEGLLTNIHNSLPSVPVYISGITAYAGPPLTIPWASYASIAGQAISDIGYSQLVGVANGSLISDASTQLAPDGIHPNDAGETQMLAGYSAVVV